MIIFFILLGLGFLCGGIAAVVDGLPYMVLERGFTQVIIGTVVAVAGVVMLALSWVLVELRRLKQTLSNAAMAMSVASMVGSPGPEGAVPLPRLPLEPEDAGAALRPGLAAAGAGALAGVGAALATTQPSAPSEKPEDKPAEPDQAGDMRDEAGVAGVDALPAFDPFRPVDPQGEPESEPAAVPEREADLPPIAAFEPQISAQAEPQIEPEAEQAADAAEGPEAVHAVAPVDEPPEAPVVQRAPSDIEDPLTPEAAPAAAREADEFGMLRESLAGLGLGPEPADGRIEPSFTDVYRPRERADEQEGSRTDDLAAAASWMEPAPQRRAPWFEDVAPAAQEPSIPPSPAESAVVPEISWPKLDISDLVPPGPSAPDQDAPQWPPHAREAAPFEPESSLSQEQGWDDAVGEQAAPENASSPEDETASESEAEPAVPEAVAAEGDAGPAASEEGVVGAYQVGEAHFTIYADGSIQARTPDGDYSFASMDELKVYLASEKSRLGV